MHFLLAEHPQIAQQTRSHSRFCTSPYGEDRNVDTPLYASTPSLLDNASPQRVQSASTCARLHVYDGEGRALAHCIIHVYLDSATAFIPFKQQALPSPSLSTA